MRCSTRLCCPGRRSTRCSSKITRSRRHTWDRRMSPVVSGRRSCPPLSRRDHGWRSALVSPGSKERSKRWVRRCRGAAVESASSVRAPRYRRSGVFSTPRFPTQSASPDDRTLDTRGGPSDLARSGSSIRSGRGVNRFLGQRSVGARITDRTLLARFGLTRRLRATGPPTVHPRRCRTRQRRDHLGTGGPGFRRRSIPPRFAVDRSDGCPRRPGTDRLR